MKSQIKCKPELSAKEHSELLVDEIPYEDLMVMAVWADIINGRDKDAALKKHGIAEEFYNSNVDRVLNT